MGSRERKRAERQKRKTRSAQRQAETPHHDAGTPNRDGETIGDGAAADVAGAARAPANGAPTDAPESASERRNREAREALEPLQEGERPPVVTIGAILCTLVVALSVLGYALWDVLRPDEPRPQLAGVIIFVGLVGPMAWGLWKARYWAVMGFQTVLVLVIIASALGLFASLSVLLAVGNLVLLAAAGALFYFMIKAWARIQMPSRLPRE